MKSQTLRLLAVFGIIALSYTAVRAASERAAPVTDFGIPEAKVSAGIFHTVLLSSDGAVFTFGRGTRGQLGHGDTESRTIPVAIEHQALSGHTIVDVAAGDHHTVLLSNDGTVFTFGSGVDGRLGHGDTANRHVPTKIVHGNLSGHTITGIAAGGAHTVLLSSDGTVFTFGLGSHGRLGHGDTGNRNVPVAIEHEDLTGHTIAGIAAGGSHTLLYLSDGAVLSFGQGREGALGHGDTVDRSTPVPIEHESLSGKSIVEVAAGTRFSVLLAADGTVLTFGRGNEGQLGHGDTSARLDPSPIDSEVFGGHAISRITTGSAHTVLYGADAVFTFGAGNLGRLGQGDMEGRTVPVQIGHESLSGQTIVEVAAGGAHTAVLTAEGSVLTFGMGILGQLGHFDTEHRLVPAPIGFFRLAGHRMVRFETAGGGQGTLLVGGEEVSEFPFMTQFETDAQLPVEAVPEPGAYFDRWLGELSGTGGTRTLIADADKTVKAVFGESAFVLWHDTIGAEQTGEGAVVGLLHAAGAEDDPFTFGLVSGEGDADNALFAVEGNELQTTDSLTKGTYSVRLRATSQGGRTVETAFVVSVVSENVAPKVAGGNSHTVLLGSDGTVYTVGSGGFGRLGHGNTQDLTLPAPVEHDSLIGHRIIDVAAGASFTVLLSADGTVFTFGSGVSGRLGHGDTENRLEPTPIQHEHLAGHLIVAAVAAGSHTVLLSSQGAVFTFGAGGSGQLGHGDTATRFVPTQVPTASLLGHTIDSIAAGGAFTAVLTQDGTVLTFGWGANGRLGHGDTDNRLVPTPIAQEDVFGHAVTGLATGGSHTVLVSSGGTVFTFGRGDGGQLGLGDKEDRLRPARIELLNLLGKRVLRLDAAGTGSGQLLVNGEPVLEFPYYFLGEGDEELALEAISEEDSFFDHWAGDLSGTEFSQSLVLDDHKDVTAIFKLRKIVIWNQSIAAERAVPGALVSRLHAVAPPGETFTFALVSGEGDEDNGRFTIDGNELLLGDELQTGEYSIRLRATGGNGLIIERAFTIRVVAVESKIAVGGTPRSISRPTVKCSHLARVVSANWDTGIPTTDRFRWRSSIRFSPNTPSWMWLPGLGTRCFFPPTGPCLRLAGDGVEHWDTVIRSTVWSRRRSSTGILQATPSFGSRRSPIARSSSRRRERCFRSGTVGWGMMTPNPAVCRWRSSTRT